MTADVTEDEIPLFLVPGGHQPLRDSLPQTAHGRKLLSIQEKPTSVFVAFLLNLDRSFGNSLNNRKWIRVTFLTSSLVALLLDFMLYSVIVPVVPAYLVDAKMNDSNVLLLNHVNSGPNSTTNSTMTSSDRHESNVDLGILFGSKSLVQVTLNPLVGYINDKLHAPLPLTIVGHLVCVVSTVLYGVGTTYWTLLAARMVQGVGTALTVNSILTVYSRFWTDNNGRQRLVGLGTFMIAAGSLVGAPFGAFLDELGGKLVPFFTLAAAILLNLVILLVIAADSFRQSCASLPVDQTNSSETAKTSFEFEDEDPEIVGKSDIKGLPSEKQSLLMDPYIIIGAGSLIVITLTIASINPIIYLWMKQKMSATELQFGLVWLPALVPYAGAVWFSDVIRRRFPGSEWWLSIMGHTFTGLGCSLLPVCSSVLQLVFPLSATLFGYSLTEVTINPLFSTVADIRHPGTYGRVFAITSNCYEAALFAGPIIGDYLSRWKGFETVTCTVGVAVILYAPLMLIYRKFNRVYARLE